MEALCREMVENYLIRHLDNNDEDNPLEVNITVLQNNACDSQFCPVIKKMWIDTNSYLCLQEADSDIVNDLGDYSIYELMSILEGFKDYEK